MRIIPVIDLKDGHVVHAVRGERNNYQPVHHNSVLTASSGIAEVIQGFLQLYPFETFYIADLNAIVGAGDHQEQIDALLNAYPDISFWIDNGSRLTDLPVNAQTNYKIVIGTESQQSQPYPVERDFILSLDFKNEQASGHPAWFHDSNPWPQTIIVMTLSRVGGANGPDFAKLAELSAGFPAKRWIAAGGVRHRQDLQRLADLGISAALIATALHGGKISVKDITEIAGIGKQATTRY